MANTATPEALYAPLTDVGDGQLNVLLVGGGGREHAIACDMLASPLLGHLHVAPGNGGTASEAGPITTVDISPTDNEALVGYAQKHDVHLVFPTMDDSLAGGAVDAFREAGIAAWGPTRAAAEVEWSKEFAKGEMERLGIPTATYVAFPDQHSATHYVDALDQAVYPLVIKDSGLKQGKGVTICSTQAEARAALREISGAVVIEEFLPGPEVSLHAACGVDPDGNPVYRMFTSLQDAKPIRPGGPNTGGMGTYGPLEWFGDEATLQAGKMFVQPMIEGLANGERGPFEGILYPGIILTPKGPRIARPRGVEYNGRPGDTETQTHTRLWRGWLELGVLAITRQLDTLPQARVLERSAGAAVCIAIAAPGYPGKYPRGLPVNGIRAAEEIPTVKVFHAGTRREADGSFTSTGGRIVGVTATGLALEGSDGALARANAAAQIVQIPGKQMRDDIGKQPFFDHEVRWS